MCISVLQKETPPSKTLFFTIFIRGKGKQKHASVFSSISEGGEGGKGERQHLEVDKWSVSLFSILKHNAWHLRKNVDYPIIDHKVTQIFSL